MEQLRFFKQEGNKYTLKKQSTRLIIFTTIFLALSITCFVLGDPALGVLSLLLASIFPFRMSGSIVFDVSKRAVLLKQNCLAKVKEFPFDDFVQFEMIKTSSTGINVHTNLRMEFDINGKSKYVPLHESVRGTKGANTVSDEVEWLMQQGKEEA